MSNLQSLVHKKVVVLSHATSVRDAARAMTQNQVGCALVAGPEGDAAGIVTDRDLARLWGADAPSAEQTIGGFLSGDLVTADENAGLDEIVSLMESHGVRRIPLVRSRNGKRRFVGIVTLDDLIAAQLIEVPELSRVVRRQIGRRLLNFSSPHARARSEAHKSQTAQSFYSHLGATAGLARNQVPQIVHVILSALVMRVSATSAIHFLSQLPERVREPLLLLPPGPDKSISTQTILAELKSSFRFGESAAGAVLHNLISALRTWMSDGQLEHLHAQLPSDFDPYFAPVPREPAARSAS